MVSADHDASRKAVDIANPSAAAARRPASGHALNGHRVKIRAFGPSGCGKSTLLQIFNRMYDLTPGTRVKGSVKMDYVSGKFG